MSVSDNQYTAKDEVASVFVKRTFLQRSWITLKKAPFTAWLGMTIVLFYVFVAIFAPLIAPYGEAEIFKVPYAPWNETHVFGTDLSLIHI